MATAKQPKNIPNVVGVGIQNKDQPDMAVRIEDNTKKIGMAEKVTKKLLGESSRLVLEYIVLNGSPDVASVNRLLSVLTPMNRATAIRFFSHFLTHKVDASAEHVIGGKLAGEDKINKKVDLVKTFLADPLNDIWTWAKPLADDLAKDTDWGAMIERNVKTALEKGFDPYDILVACLNGGVKVDTLVELAKFKTDEEKPKDQAAA